MHYMDSLLASDGHVNDLSCLNYLSRAVKSDELKWLPKGSEFLKISGDSNSSTKAETYTSFSSNQASIPEFASSPISIYPDIIVAKLGPGQVMSYYQSSFFLLLFFILKLNPLIISSWQSICIQHFLVNELTIFV